MTCSQTSASTESCGTGRFGTAAPLREPIGVRAHAAIVGEPTARGACRVPIERIAALLANQQALEERGPLRVPSRELPVLVEAILGQCELRARHQGGHRDLDPLRARARPSRTPRYRDRPNPQLVADGFVQVMAVPPNVKYQDLGGRSCRPRPYD
jgi:hypothetical protein